MSWWLQCRMVVHKLPFNKKSITSYIKTKWVVDYYDCMQIVYISTIMLKPLLCKYITLLKFIYILELPAVMAKDMSFFVSHTMTVSFDSSCQIIPRSIAATCHSTVHAFYDICQEVIPFSPEASSIIYGIYILNKVCPQISQLFLQTKYSRFFLTYGYFTKWNAEPKAEDMVN